MNTSWWVVLIYNDEWTKTMCRMWWATLTPEQHLLIETVSLIIYIGVAKNIYSWGWKWFPSMRGGVLVTAFLWPVSFLLLYTTFMCLIVFVFVCCVVLGTAAVVGIPSLLLMIIIDIIGRLNHRFAPEPKPKFVSLFRGWEENMWQETESLRVGW